MERIKPEKAMKLKCMKYGCRKAAEFVKEGKGFLLYKCKCGTEFTIPTK